MATKPADDTTTDSVQAKIDSLRTRIDRRVGGFTHHSQRFSGLHRNIALFLAGLAALNTFFVAVNEGKFLGEDALINFGLLALITSALLAFLTAVESNMQAREKYAKNAKSLNAVHDIKARLEWRLLETEKPMTHDEIDAYHVEYRNIVREFFGEFVEIGTET